jgi:hypothetical protein
MVERKGTFKKLEVMRHYPRNMTEREGIFKNLEVARHYLRDKRMRREQLGQNLADGNDIRVLSLIFTGINFHG